MTQEPGTTVERWSFRRRIALIAGCIVVVYLTAAYLIVPAIWKRYEHKHPSLDDIPRITHTKDGVPGDPLNVAIIGTEVELIEIMNAANWHRADPLSLRSDLEIAEASVLKRSDEAAPVSNLFLFGRKEDLAFEQQVDNNPRQRHHVRFWRIEKIDWDGRPNWVGSAVFDEHVGVSRRSGQITHVTAANVDAERNYLFKCLKQTGDLAEEYVVAGFHKICEGKNGGGDPWHTDGNLDVGVIAQN